MRVRLRSGGGGEDVLRGGGAASGGLAGDGGEEDAPDGGGEDEEGRLEILREGVDEGDGGDPHHPVGDEHGEHAVEEEAAVELAAQAGEGIAEGVPAV